ncbi:MAG: hypothetical protein D8M59_05830 [Planctomycetes bacterium]|nr:hypothetical protein [Planctomycetota bacterium]NOG55898.1 DUF5309 family protein [Planctomycetota bacterium]
MPFTGKATYTAGAALPEIAEDVSDIIGIISPHETPLLDHLGDPQRSATSTVHEWLEDSLLPNSDRINDATFGDPVSDTQFVVDNGDRFQIGDQIQADGSREVMFVTAVDTGTDTLTVVRGYGGTTAEALADDLGLLILGNAALEGADRPAARFTTRTRKQNYTQIFTSSVEVSGSQLATRMLAVDDELDYQKQQRLRELIRDLENCIVNGVAPASAQEGSDSVRRTMRGIVPSIASNIYTPGVGPIPDGDGGGQDLLNEAVINAALRAIWQSSSGHVDTIVVNGFQKRRVNSIIFPNRSYSSIDEKLKNLVSVYESDYGVCRVILSRWIPSDTALLLDSSRLDVLPLAGRSFHYKPLSSQGDSEVGELIGEYTLEMRNENAHGLIQGLGTTE